MILGRAQELKYLNTYYDRTGSQIMVVYGEKNVGKTTLLRQFVQDKPCYYYRARSASEREQRYQWGRELGDEGVFCQGAYGLANYFKKANIKSDEFFVFDGEDILPLTFIVVSSAIVIFLGFPLLYKSPSIVTSFLNV